MFIQLNLDYLQFKNDAPGRRDALVEISALLASPEAG